MPYCKFLFYLIFSQGYVTWRW